MTEHIVVCATDQNSAMPKAKTLGQLGEVNFGIAKQIGNA
jgi:hypothetical protein